MGWDRTEGGYPQMVFTFLPSLFTDEAFMSSDFVPGLTDEFTGSIDPADARARFRTPAEVNWSWMAKFDHDYIGREALASYVMIG